jgi:hypothetical protein
MSADTTPGAQQSAPIWPPLAVAERRVLGVLVEKQKTSKTPDAYPLTLNALQTGCNQKSNRDPLLSLDEVEVEEACDALGPRGLVERLTGGRVDRFRHKLYDTWTSDSAGLAVLAELLLRGPQTKGDLRTRAARMAPIESLDALEDVLKPLVERGLVVYLTDPDRRGAIVTHGFHAADELAQLKVHHSNAPVPVSEVAAPRISPAAAVTPLAAPAADRLAAALAEIDALKARVSALEARVAELGGAAPSPTSPAGE